MGWGQSAQPVQSASAGGAPMIGLAEFNRESNPDRQPGAHGQVVLSPKKPKVYPIVKTAK